MREWIWTGPDSLAGLEGPLAPWERVVGPGWAVTVEPFGAALAVRLDAGARRVAWIGPVSPEEALGVVQGLVLDAEEVRHG